MVQREIKKKTYMYGLAAVLSVVILVSLIYSFGVVPNLFPPSQIPAASAIKTFISAEDLKNFLNGASTGAASYSGGPLDSEYFRTPTPTSTSTAISSGLPENLPESGGTQTSTFSTTNIQVAGVDEADTVKTSGAYIYTISTVQNEGYYLYGAYFYGYYTNSTVYIIKADPQNPGIVSRIFLGNDAQAAGLYLSQDGSKLVVIASKYQTYYGPVMPMIQAYNVSVYTYIYVYDVSNPANPTLARNFTASGSYFDSRMIGNYVYAVVSQPAEVYNDNVSLPQIYNSANETDISPTSIYYAEMVQPSYYEFTSFFGINIMDDSEQPANLTVLMGGTSTMYVSQGNMYVVYPTWASQGEFSSIYKVAINGAQLSFQAAGNVPGYVINQYSMDEYNGYFRIATNWQPNFESGNQINNIYVLNSNLTIVGRLEGLEKGENLYSARFMEDKCYLVTFKQTDPFFIVDLSNPEAPSVAGELTIPGYSSYLQPYDENHVIGFGSVTAIVNGVESTTFKLALFDVTIINHPAEVANYTVEGNYTTSSALYDPKAILFNQEKQLLVIPVSIMNYAYTYVNDNTPGASGSGQASQSVIMSYEGSWQGAYVFNVNPNSGFTLNGNVTCLNETLFDSNGLLNGSLTSAFYSSQNNYITRSLYIDDNTFGTVLYTVSNAEIKLISLADMTRIAEVDLT